MTALPVLCALLAAAPPPASGHEPLVAVSTGRLLVLGDRSEVRDHLEKADRLVGEALGKAKTPLLAELLGNARNRLDNAREFLGFEREEERALIVPKEGHEDDERLADAVVSQRLVVTDLETLWWELGRADFNLSKAGAAGPELQGPVEQARGEVSLARTALSKLVGPAPAPDEPQAAAEPLRLPRFPDAAAAGSGVDTLLAALDREAAVDDRLRVLEGVPVGQLVTVEQSLLVLGRFPFSAFKLRAARVLRDRLLDRANAAKLQAAFTFESDKAALRRILDGGEVEAPRPIDNDALDLLVHKLKGGYATQVGHQILREEAGRRFFLVDQVSRILGVFPTFEARLRALQLMAPRVLDPEGWEKLQPLFATMEDRAQLGALFVLGR